MDIGIRETPASNLHKFVQKLVILLPSDTRLSETEIELVLEQLFVLVE